MTSILDMNKAAPPKDYFAEITNFFMPLKYLLTNENVDIFLKNVNFNYLVNAMFWIFLIYAIFFAIFGKILQFFLKTTTNIKYYKRKQFVRSLWNIAFYAACTFFLYFYNEFILLPQISKNQGRYSLFYSSENLIFHKSEQCEKFQVYSLLIITFYLHGAILDVKESDYLEAASKALYLLALVAIDIYNYENYFVGLNISLGIYFLITETIYLLASQSSPRGHFIYQIFLVLRFASWSHIFISLVPFKYLVPTLFAKNFKLTLNVWMWLWYGLSIWNSPVLGYFYHQIYHNSPQDCIGEGSAARCILLRDSSEHRHFKTLQKAYFEVKLAHEKNVASAAGVSATEISSSAKAFQALKCVMTLKRKLKRIREGRGSEQYEEDFDESLSAAEN